MSADYEADYGTHHLVTILRSAEIDGRRPVLTKHLMREGDAVTIVPFSGGRLFDVTSARLRLRVARSAARARIAPAPTAAWCAARFCPMSRADISAACPIVAMHGKAVTFEEQARSWLALDIDGVPDPDCFPADPEAGVEHVLELLPAPFQEASCWWQATSSAGVKPGIRCRLWFKLSRDIADGEAKGWLAGYPVDSSIFCAVAPHYTAAPILGPGVADPVTRRFGVRQGLIDTVEVPDELPFVVPIARQAVELDGAELSYDALAALTSAVRASPVVRAIWTGRQTYQDRSRSHLALASALVRAGCRDPGVLAAVIPQYAQRSGHDVAKASRPDYLARTVSAALGVAP